jgi:hypothetical protein
MMTTIRRAGPAPEAEVSNWASEQQHARSAGFTWWLAGGKFVTSNLADKPCRINRRKAAAMKASMPGSARRMILLVLVMVCAAPLCGQDVVDQAALQRRAVALERQKEKFSRIEAARLRIAIEWVAIPADPDDDELLLDDSKRRRARLSEVWFNELVFNKQGPPPRDELQACLMREIERVDRIFGFSPMQKQKLQLAGQGDIIRLVDRFEELRRKLLTTFADGDHINGLVNLKNEVQQQGSTLRRKFAFGPFDKDSLFSKTLRTILTGEQVAKYEQWLLDLPVPVTRSWDNQVTR